MLNEVKPNLDLLMSIRLGLAEQYGIPLDVPFRDYKAWYRWTGMEVPTQTMRADFVNQLYSKEGKPCRFEDIFEFERLSKAWLFDEDGLQEWDIDEPRLSDKGLLIEPERTNRYNNFSWISNNSNVYPVEREILPHGISIKSLRGDGAFSIYHAKTDSSLAGLSVVESGTVVAIEDFVGGFGFSREEYITIDAGGYGQIWNVRKLPSGNNGRMNSITGDKGKHFEFVYGQYEIGEYVTSYIKTEHSGAPVTRLRDSLSTTIPQGHTITGDWDDTLHLFERDGQLDFEGYGYIRMLEMIPMEGSYTADFTKDVIISHTGFEHRGIFGRGIFEFERLSKAWDFIGGELKEYQVNIPRVSSEGLLIEPEHQNRFPTTLFEKVSNLDKTQVVDDYFLSNSFKSTKLIGVAQDVEDKTNGYWYQSTILTVKEDGEFPIKRVGFILDVSKCPNLRYLRFFTFWSFPHTHRFPTIVDLKTLEVLQSIADGIKGAMVRRFGDIVLVDFTNEYKTTAYRSMGVQLGFDGDDWQDRSTWRALSEGEEVIISCQQWINDFDKPLLTVIPSISTPTTRLPDTFLTREQVLSIDKDEGILHEDGVFSGFGYIRKIEVKV